MREGILTLHDTSLPATHNRNTNRIPIDGIFVTAALKIDHAGYDTFGKSCASDHRPIWLDIKYESAFHTNTDVLEHVQPRRLQASNLRMVRKFNAALEDIYRKHHTQHKL